MAEIVRADGQEFKKRNIFAVWLGLPIITLGIYTFVWYYKINDEARRYLRDESIRPGISVLALSLGWVIILPPFISIYRTGKRIKRAEQLGGVGDCLHPTFAFLLVFPLGILIIPALYHYAYTIRHQVLSDLKATFGAGDTVASAAGHSTDRTQSKYASVHLGRKLMGYISITALRRPLATQK